MHTILRPLVEPHVQNERRSMTWNQGPYEIFQNHNCIAKTTGCPLRFCNLIMMNGLGCSIPTQVKMIVIMQGHQLYFILLWMMSAAACLNWIPLSIIFGKLNTYVKCQFWFQFKDSKQIEIHDPKKYQIIFADSSHPSDLEVAKASSVSKAMRHLRAHAMAPWRPTGGNSEDDMGCDKSMIY